MQNLTLLTLAVAPAIFLMTYVYLRDRYEREPLGLVVRTFLAGMLAALPVLALGATVAEPAATALALGAAAHTVWTSFVTAGLLEEFFKMVAVWFVAYRSAHFNEPFDGIVYATAASLGFATLENVLYVFVGGVQTGIGRAVLSVPGHALFGIIMGFYLGAAKFAASRWRALGDWLLALLVPVVLHGVYDVLVLNANRYQIAGYLLYPLVAYLWVRGTHNMRHHIDASPFRPGLTGAGEAEMVALAGRCPQCGSPVVATAAYCHTCGTALAMQAP